MRGESGILVDPVAGPAVEVVSYALERVPTQHQLAAAHPAPEILLLFIRAIHTSVLVSSEET